MVRYGSIPFEGCCALLGMLSQSPPQSGAAHRIRISRDEADKAIASLCGTPLTGRLTSLKRHGGAIIGYVTEAWTTNTEVRVRGTLWTAHQQSFLKEVRAGRIGLSIEALDASFHHKWMKDFKFNGIAALYKEHCAYSDTWLKVD